MLVFVVVIFAPSKSAQSSLHESSHVALESAECSIDEQHVLHPRSIPTI